jgi:RNA polymerase sigma-70 factor, ECF subfamily
VDQRKAIAAELPRLRRYARALQRDPGAADDLVQDCLERALSRMHLFQSGTNLRAWLFTILHNVHVNSVRGRIRTAERVVASTDGDIGIDGVTDPAQSHGLELRDLSRALDALTEEQRQVVLLIGLEDMSYRDASEILGVPVGTVMSRLSRGRERLRVLTSGENPQILRRVK